MSLCRLQVLSKTTNNRRASVPDDWKRVPPAYKGEAVIFLEKLIVARPIIMYFLNVNQWFFTVHNSPANKLDLASTFRLSLKPFLILSPFTQTSRKWSRQVNDSDVPTTSSRKQLQPSAVVFTSAWNKYRRGRK
jgi:hypothetical protein